MRRPPFAAAALLLALACSVHVPAAGAQTSPDALPDLVAPPPGPPRAPEVARLADGQIHLLVRFDGSIYNAGSGPLEIRGSRPVNGVMTVTGQRIYRRDGTFHDDNRRHPPIHFENADGHQHWHLKGAARFSLWDEAGTSEVAPAAKVGFCLLDSERVAGFGPPNRVYSKSATQYCRQGQANAAQLYEGISPGWLDFYAAELPFQWVDISDVAPGRYRLGAEMDPDDFVVESSEANNGPALGAATLVVAGYVASPLAATMPQAARSLTIGLGAQRHGTPGPPIFRIESAPSHGTLNQPAGADFADAQVVYTPVPGFAGQDTFSYSARDGSSSFPQHPRAAAVTVAVPGTAARKARARLVTGVRFSRRGRRLAVRARARKSGMLRVQIRKRGRHLGSCRRRVRSGHRFLCRLRLRGRMRSSGRKAVFTLRVDGRAAAAEVVRVPRRLRRG
jgi:hypothetical protein